MGKYGGVMGDAQTVTRSILGLLVSRRGGSRDKKVTDGKRKRPCEVPMTILHKVLISNFLVGFQGMGQGCEKESFVTVFRMPSFVP